MEFTVVDRESGEVLAEGLMKAAAYLWSMSRGYDIVDPPGDPAKWEPDVVWVEKRNRGGAEVPSSASVRRDAVEGDD